MLNLLVIVLSALLFLGYAERITDLRNIVLPGVEIEASTNGSFRAYMPDRLGVQSFEVHASINKPLSMPEQGEFFMEVKEKTGDYWIATFPDANVTIGDTVNFWVFCYVYALPHKRDNLSETISEQWYEYPALLSRCVFSDTISNGTKSCIGDVVFQEQFSGPTLDSSKWNVEHWIPTYTPPNYFFNSYTNSNQTQFIEDGILHLKPIAFESVSDVRGVLDLRKGCSSKTEKHCYFRSKSWSILPPVQSAKITSKFSFKYGMVEVRAKLPAGDWIVPVIRLEQVKKGNGEASPVVWIAYSRGNEHLYDTEKDYGAYVVFAGPAIQPGRNEHLAIRRGTEPFYTKYHTYSLQWVPGKMSFSIDKRTYGSVDLSQPLGSRRGTSNATEVPYHKEFIISLGVAVGGLIDFPDRYTAQDHDKPWRNTEAEFLKNFFEQRSAWLITWNGNDAALKVDYVKVTAV